MAAQWYSVSTILPNFVLSSNLLRLHSVQSSRPLMNVLNSIGPEVNFWGAPPVTGLCLDFRLLITILCDQQFIQLSIYLTVHLSSPYLIILSEDIMGDSVESPTKIKTESYLILPFFTAPVISLKKAVRLARHDFLFLNSH